jgi:hypothetical protein
MDWRPYKACCPPAAAHSNAAFCNECGHTLLRCMAFAECKGLVTPNGECPMCVSPSLMIDAGAGVQAKKGDRVSVPLVLRNASAASRPIWVKRIVKGDGRFDEPVALTWEHLDAGTERRFNLDAPPLAEGGTQTLSIILVIASRYKGLEEEYAFSSAVRLTVSSEDAQQTTINISGGTIHGLSSGGDVIGAHATVSEGGHAISGDKALLYKSAPGETTSATPVAERARTVLDLQRAEKWELQNGIRGYREQNVRVPRNVEFGFTGFRQTDAPDRAVTLPLAGRLACGRNSRQPDPTGKSLPSDLCLRAYDRTGTVDEPATMAISRHHFDLVIVNERLCVQSRSTHGMELNDKPLASGEVAWVTPTDRLVPIPGHPEKLTLKLHFAASFGSVDRIEIRRTPAMTP